MNSLSQMSQLPFFLTFGCLFYLFIYLMGMIFFFFWLNKLCMTAVCF